MLEESNHSENNRAEQRSPISLSMLFYFVTIAAIVAASIRYIQSDSSVTFRQVVLACVICALTGMLLGFGMWMRGVAKFWPAPLLGIALGAAIGPLLCVRLTHFSELIAMSFFGSWILVTLMCITARLSTKRIHQSQ